MHLGERLKELREQQKMTQLDLARLTNLPCTAISKIEHGVRQVNGYELKALTDALGITPNEFYGVEALRPRRSCVKMQRLQRAMQDIRAVVATIDADLEAG